MKGLPAAAAKTAVCLNEIVSQHMVSAEIAEAMVKVYAAKHGLSEAEAIHRMERDPNIRALLERDEVGGIAAAIARDRHLAYGDGSTSPRLAPILQLLDPHVQKALTGSSNRYAVDLCAGTAVYTVAFAEQWPELQFYAAEREDSGSTLAYPTGLHQTREALRAAAAECDPVDVADGRRLLCISEPDGGTPCAVREGDVIRTMGLQRAELNGKLGVALNKRSDGERIAVQLQGDHEPKAFRAKNLAFEQPGGTLDSIPAHELERLRLEVMQLARRQCILGVSACELDLKRPQTWENKDIRAMRGKCTLVTCMSVLSQVGFETPSLWQQVLQVGAALLCRGGVLMLYDTEKWGGFANEDVMRPFAAKLGLILVEKAEPVKYGKHADGRFFALTWRKHDALI